MKKRLHYLLFGGLFALIHSPVLFGQATDKIIFGGLSFGTGIGRYHPIEQGLGIQVRGQYPLTPKVALTAKIGLERYRASLSSLMPYSYLGYGYNPISGFGFNTLYVNYAGYDYKATILNIPIVLGPRLYVTDRIHADLNMGVDVSPVRGVKPSLHVEPGAGYLLPLGNGRSVDLTLGFFTDFSKGNGGILTMGAGYGLPWSRVR